MKRLKFPLVVVASGLLVAGVYALTSSPPPPTPPPPPSSPSAGTEARGRLAGRARGTRVGASRASSSEASGASASGFHPTIVKNPAHAHDAEAQRWERMSSPRRRDHARREFDRAVVKMEESVDDDEREAWRSRAGQALSAARSDFFSSQEGMDVYVELESRIEE